MRGEVEGEEVAGRGRAVDVVERAGAAQLGLDGLLDLLVGGIGSTASSTRRPP